MLPETIGRYQIKEELGRGQSTVVYRAFDTEANREVAVKVLAVEQVPDISQRAHFKRELKMIASLEHPAIVPVYDVGEHNGQPYFVMRYMAGGSLTQLLASRGKLPLEDLPTLLDHLCRHQPRTNKHHSPRYQADNIIFDLDHNPVYLRFSALPNQCGRCLSTIRRAGQHPVTWVPNRYTKDPWTSEATLYSLGWSSIKC
jgi:serine/threonine protein kinase